MALLPIHRSLRPNDTAQARERKRRAISWVVSRCSCLDRIEAEEDTGRELEEMKRSRVHPAVDGPHADAPAAGRLLRKNHRCIASTDGAPTNNRFVCRMNHRDPVGSDSDLSPEPSRVRRVLCHVRLSRSAMVKLDPPPIEFEHEIRRREMSWRFV